MAEALVWLGQAQAVSPQVVQGIRQLVALDDRLDEGGELDEVDGMTIEEAKEKMICDRIEEMRPQASWKAIAKSLGIAEKTLWVKRKELGYTCD